MANKECESKPPLEMDELREIYEKIKDLFYGYTHRYDRHAMLVTLVESLAKGTESSPEPDLTKWQANWLAKKVDDIYSA